MRTTNNQFDAQFNDDAKVREAEATQAEVTNASADQPPMGGSPYSQRPNRPNRRRNAVIAVAIAAALAVGAGAGAGALLLSRGQNTQGAQQSTAQAAANQQDAAKADAQSTASKTDATNTNKTTTDAKTTTNTVKADTKTNTTSNTKTNTTNQKAQAQTDAQKKAAADAAAKAKADAAAKAKADADAAAKKKAEADAAAKAKADADAKAKAQAEQKAKDDAAAKAKADADAQAQQAQQNNQNQANAKAANQADTNTDDSNATMKSTAANFCKAWFTNVKVNNDSDSEATAIDNWTQTVAQYVDPSSSLYGELTRGKGAALNSAQNICTKTDVTACDNGVVNVTVSVASHDNNPTAGWSTETTDTYKMEVHVNGSGQVSGFTCTNTDADSGQVTTVTH